jgi:glyoxylase-like metal-dependent hydrolase (beta-lactamase superfamily II)
VIRTDRSFTCAYGVLEPVSPHIRRIVARNPGPFTFRGTGTYVIGRGQVAIVDPGPDLPEHVDSLLAALAGESVTHILISHTHRDHSPAAAAVKAATGGRTYGFGPHGKRGETAEVGADLDFTPDVTLADGDVIEGGAWRIAAVHTPGHASNHLCFALAEERALFSGDHVMGWSTTVIAPPDGDMAAYMRSLDLLLRRDDGVYWPTHGGPIVDPRGHVNALIAHRHARRAAIRAALGARPTTPEEMIPAVYGDLDPRLTRGAAKSVLAHLLEMAEQGEAIHEDGGWRAPD